MARQSHGRLRLGRIFSPKCRSAAAVASAEAQEKRRKKRVQKWRDRFKRLSLSVWHQNAIVATVCNLFRSSAETARTLRAATGSQMVGVGSRQLRIEGLEQRQMLNATYHNLASSDFSQNWSNTDLITADNNWNNVPSIIGYADNLTTSAGADPSTRTATQTTQNVTANQFDSNLNATGGIAEFQPIFFDNFDGYANQAAFEAAWPAIGTTTITTPVDKRTAQLSTVQSVSPSNAVFVPVSTTATTTATEFRNRRSFGETGTISTSTQLVWSFDFYDSVGGNPQRNFSNLQDTTGPGSTNQLVSMGLNNNQLSTDSGGNYYMARILGYTVVAGADVDGGANESGTLGAGAYFKLNDFGTSPLRSVGWHNLKVVISTNDGLSTDYEFYVDNILAERVLNVSTAANFRSYDNIAIGSGLTNGSASAYFDNQRLEVVQTGGYNPVVGVQGSGTADAPALVLHMDATGRQNVTLNFNARDLDGNADDAIQKIGVQYRIGNSGNFTHLVTSADLTTISSATQVTPISVTLPGLVANQSQLQIRILTSDATGADEWVGIDDITVTSIAIQPPVFTSSATPSVAESTTPVVTLTTTDPDVPTQTPTYSITGGADAALFNLVGNQLSFATSRDFENPTDADTNGVYLVEVTANDGNGGLTVQSLSVTVTDANDSPTFTSTATPSVLENSTSVVTLTATDQDLPPQTVAFSITGGIDQARFALVGNQLQFNTAPDFESPSDDGANNVYVVEVTADDGNLGLTVQTVTVTVTPVNESSPVVTSANSFNVAENSTSVGTVTSTDADLPGDTITYTLSGGADMGLFSIGLSSGALSFNAPPDYELPSDANTDNTYEIEVSVFDGLNTTTQTISVNVTPENDNAPVITSANSANVPENQTVVLSVTSTDAEVPAGPAPVYNLSGGADQSAFSIDSGSGALSFNVAPDYEAPGDVGTNNVYEVQVSVFDGVSTTSQLISVTVTPVNEFTPIANADFDNVTEDSDLVATGNVLTNDSDSDAPPEMLTVAPAFVGPQAGTYGTLNLAADGSYTYTLNNAAIQSLAAGNQLLESPFLYRTTDGTNLSLGAFLNITINGTSDPALITGDSSGSVSEDGTLVDSGTLNVSDIDAAEASFQPAAANTLYGSYTLDSSGNWVYTLDNSNSAVQTLTTGQSLNDSFTTTTIDGTTQLVSITIDGLDELPGVIILNGDGTSNQLVIDLDAGTYTLDGGTPQPLAGIADITFHAGADLGDSLVITGGTFGTVVYDYAGPSDGDIDLSDYGLMLHYTGLDPISNDGSVANAIFNLPSSNDNASLLISSPGNLTLSSSPSTFESTTFVMPSGSVTVNAGDGNDTITVEPSNGYTVNIDGGNHTVGDTLNVDAGGAYAINNGSEVRVQGKANIGYSDFEFVNLTNVGALTTLYVDDNWAGTTAGDDPDGFGVAINFGVDSFATLADALAAANDNYTIIVHAGTYTGSYVIDDKVTIIGAGDGVVTLNANGDFTGIEIQDVVSISGVSLTNYLSTGILVSAGGNLTLSNSTVAGGLTGISVVGGTLDMDHTIVNGVGVVGVQVGSGGFADIETSEITGTATTAAGVAVSSGNALIDNTIITASNRGVLVSSTGTATIHGSKLFGNAIGNVVNGTVNTIDASGNAWGSNVDSSIALTLVGPVDFTPYLDSSIDQDGGARGFSGDFSHVHVTTAGGQSGGGGRIQEGVDEVSAGGLVDVHAGTYLDNVVINQSVHLQGLDTTAGDASGDVVVLPAVGGTEVIMIQSNDVEIEKLTIDGDNGAIDANLGIASALGLSFTGLDIHNNKIRNVVERGIRLGYHLSTSPTTFTITDNSIENVSDPASFGILTLHGSGTISGNDITGAWIGIITNQSAGVLISANEIHDTDYGIYLANSGGAVGPADEVAGNTIDTGASTASVGIEVFNAGKNVSIHDNIISDVNVGMNIYSALAAPAGDLVTIADNTISDFVGTASVGLFISSDDFGGNAGAVNLEATASGNTITGAETGIWVQGAAGRTATITINDDNEISGSDTGIYIEEVTGGTATVTIDGNGSSIHGNTIGIDVAGGSATITGNHIYDNTTGIRFINGGTGTIGGALVADGNEFNDDTPGDTDDDNATDILVAASAGTVTIAANNTFAGDNFFVDNQSTQDILATGNAFDVANDFRVEDKMSHKVDNLAFGLVTWVAGNLFVTTPGVGSTDSSIQRGIDAANAGNTVNVEAGTYVENVSIDKNLTLLSATGRGTTTIQGISGVGSLGTVVLSGTTTDVNIGGDLTPLGPGDNGFTILGIDNGLPGIENGAIYILGTHSGTDILWNDVVANGDHGLVAEFGANLSNLTIDNNIFSGKTFVGPNPDGVGFSAQFSLPNVPRQLVVIGNESIKSNITFTNNNLTGTTGGISLTDNSGSPIAAHEQGNSLVTIDATGTLISGNTFNGSTADTAFSLRARGTNNVITGNQFVSASMGATTVDLFVNDTGNTIQGNQFTSSAGAAIQVAGGSATVGGLGVGEGNTIAGYTTGILVTSGNALLYANSATGGAYGLYAAGGNVLAQGNTLSGNNVGIHVSGNAVVDAGSINGTDGNPTGLGNSAGGNILTGYTGTLGNYAIEDLNLDSGGNVDVYARNNNFGSATPSAIEQVVFHTVDNPLNTIVFFTPAIGAPVPAAVYVNDDWFGTGLGVDPNAGYANGNIFGTDAFASIQDAINAVGTNATIYVLNGTYDEAVVVNKAGTTLQHLDTINEPADPNSATEAYVTRTFGSNSAVIQVTADGVTIDDFHIIINRPNSTVGIGASNTASSTFLGGSFDDLTITNNVITSVGTGGTVDTAGMLTTLSSGIALVGNGTPFEKVTIQGNTVDITGGAPAGFQHRAVWLREIEASVTGNDLKGRANDLIVQFAASATSTATTISGNTFRSGGVDLTENAASGAINVTNNQFLITSPTSAQSLVIKHDVAAPILVQGNTFSGHAIGISMGNSAAVTIDDNDFTPGAFANTADIVLDTANFTGGSPAAPFLPLTATITKNEFFGSVDANNHVGLALYNRNPGAASPDYGPVTIGGAGAENTFHKDLDTFIYLDPATLGGVPVAFDFDASLNKYEVTGSPVAGVLPTGMTLSQLFEVEDKIVHAVDVASLGFVTILPGNVYVTANSYFAPITTTPSIQRGVDVATAGDTVNVAAGTYVGNVSIDKSLTLKSGSGRLSTTIQGVSGVGALGSVVITNNTNNVKIGDLTGNGFTIVGIDNGNPGIENGAVYLQGNHSGIEIRYNDIVANGDAGLMTEFGLTNTNFIIDNNIFSGQTFVGPTPADNGFTNQFSTPNVPRQLVVMGSGSGTTTTSNVTFTNNLISGTAGGSNGGGEQGNSLVTIDALGTNISGNTFSGTTTRFGNSLRARGANNSITGNFFTSTGMGATTVDLYVNRAGNVIQGNTFSSSAGGAIQVDTALGAATIGGAVLGQANSISGYTTGLTLTGGSAIVDSNSFSSSAVADINVDGGKASVQSNTFGGTIGVLIQNGGIADLGQTGKTTTSDFTGLGISTGSNIFSGYSTTATTTAGAIVNLNTNGANANAGRQGAPFDVTAFGNTWAVPTSNGIENVVYHDSDAPGVGFVDFANFGSLTVTADSATTINEGGSVSISGLFANVPQAHTITILWGDGSNTVINNLSGDFDFSSSHVYADNTDGTPFSLHNITVTVTDASAAVIGPSAPIVVHVDNTNPTITSYLGSTTAGTGQTKHYTFTAADLGDVPAERLASVLLIPSGGASASLVGPVVFDGTNGSFDVLFTSLPGGGSVDVQLTVTDDDSGSDVETITVSVGNTLQVTNFVTNPSGFDATFNRAPNLADLNLYDGRLSFIDSRVVFDPSDIVVTRQVGVGPATVVEGSMAWNALTNTLSWVKTGSILADDVLNYTYNVTLKSSATAFHDSFGNLDGNGDFDDTPGEDYTSSFLVNGTTARVVGLKDIARGPGQDLDVLPAANNGWAVTLDDATNVRSLNFHLRYDPSILAINGAALAPGLAGMGWIITVNNTTPGDLIIQSSSPANELSGFNVPVIIIDATVKSTAAYGDAEIVRFETVAVGIENGAMVDPAPHIEDRAIHKVNYVGDADGNHLYDGFDVTLMSRYAASIDPGFGNLDWTNPVIIGDVNNDGIVDSIDTSIVSQKVIFPASTPQIANIVVPSPAVLSSGADPILSIGDNIPAGIGGPVVVPVNLAIDPNITLYSATYTVQYDPAKLTFVGVAGAGVFSGWSTVSGAGAGTITILMSDTNGHPTGGSIENVQLANITFNVLETFTGSTSNLNIAPVNPNEGGVFWDNENADDGSVQFALLGDYNQNGVVDTADRTVWRNTFGQSVTPYSGADGNGNGVVDNDDFNVWRSHFGIAAVPGPGAGAGDELAAAFSMSAVAPQSLAASVAGGMDLVETSQPVAAEAVASSDESARDEAFGDVVESVEVARTFARPSSKVSAQPTVGATYAANNLLASLASAEDRRHEDGSCLSHDDSDMEAVDELFASLDDESLQAALSL